MPLPPPGSPLRTFSLTTRLARAGGRVEFAAGLAGMGYCIAVGEEGLTLGGFFVALAVFGGLGIVSGLLLCDLADHLGRRKRWMFALLAVVAGVHGAALLWGGGRLLPDYRHLFDRPAGVILLHLTLLTVLGGVVVLDGFLLVSASEAIRHLPKRRRRGRAFRPALRVLPIDDPSDTPPPPT